MGNDDLEKPISEKTARISATSAFNRNFKPRLQPEGGLRDRKRPDHGVLPTRNGPTIVFVTCCTKDRRPWLHSAANHEILRTVWSEATGWMVGRYVIMPDHVHLFAAPGTMDIPLETWCRYWKRLFTQRAAGTDRHWQASQWDTRMRSAKAYAEKWEYVLNNPVRHALVTSAGDWPYQGQVFEIGW